MARFDKVALIAVHPPTQDLVLETTYGITTVKVGTPEYDQLLEVVKLSRQMTTVHRTHNEVEMG